MFGFVCLQTFEPIYPTVILFLCGIVPLLKCYRVGQNSWISGPYWVLFQMQFKAVSDFTAYLDEVLQTVDNLGEAMFQS
jgi:hypothetical protein